MSTTMNRLFCSFCYHLFFLAAAIRTAVGQAPAPAQAPVQALPPVQAPPPVQALAPAQALAPTPGPAGPTNVTAILEKGGVFNTLIKLMKSTPVASQLNSELNNTNNGRTILAPTDDAFSALPPGTLNGLNDHEKTTLVEFHILPSFIALSQFETVSNPVTTMAGSIGKYGFPLNVSTGTNNTVKVSTGINNTTIASSLYADNQLAVYRINKVLLPLGLFGPKPPPPAPAPAPTPTKKEPLATTALPVDISGDMGLRDNAVVGLVGAVVAVLWL